MTTTTTALQTIRACIERDLGVEPQSVIKVDELKTLRTDLTEYVLTDQLAREYARVFERMIEAARPASGGVGDVGVWVSGFFGSGKSLFAKLAGHVLADTRVGEETARALFAGQLKPGRAGDDRLAELFQEAANYRLHATLVAFDIMSQHTAAAERNVGVTFLRTFYRSLGLSTIIPIAQAELELQRAGKYEAFTRLYAGRGDRVPWEQDRDVTTCTPVFAECLAELLPHRYPSPDLALQSLDLGLRQAETQTGIEDVVKLLLRWLDEQDAAGGRAGAARLIFVADEVGAWAGRNLDRIEQLRAFVEALGRLGQGRIWLLVTSQEKLSDVLADTENAGANSRLLQRLEARFRVNVHLDSSEVSTVIADRVLAKKATARDRLLALWRERQQTLLDIAAPPNLEMGGNYPRPEAEAFLADYPFLPYQLPAAADLFGSMRGVKVSSGARSMLKVAFDATRAVADHDIGTVVAWDQIFDSANSGNEFADEQYLGSLGLEHIRQADRDLPDAPVQASRVLKVLWLMQHNPNVPRTPANLARLLVRDLARDDVLALEQNVRTTLEALEQKNFARHDPATEQWKHLSQDEVTVEQLLQRIGEQDIKARQVRDEIGKIYQDRLARTFPGRITVGQTATAFGYAVEFESTSLKGEGQPVTLRVLLPAPGTEKRAAEENATNLDAPVVTWVVGEARRLEQQMRRALAIERLPADEQFRQIATDRTRQQAERLLDEAGQLRRAADAEVERALSGGRLYYAGTEVALDELSGGATARSEIERALRERIESVYSSFSDADRKFRAENAEKLFTVPPSERAALDPALGIFAADGHVRGNHALVEPVVGYLKSASRTSGQDVMDAFARVPYGWPGDLLRYIAAALFVDGKVAATDRSGVRYDDPKAPGARQLFGTQAFKATRIEVEEDALSPEEVTAARALLGDLGRRTSEGTEVALKDATLQLCADLSKRAAVLERAHAEDFPLPEGYATIPGLVRDVQEAGSRVKVVRSLLAHGQDLRAANTALSTLEAFNAKEGFAQYRRMRQLMTATEDAGLEGLPGIGEQASEAREQLDHLIAQRRVLEDWEGAVKRNRLRLIEAFRDAYAPLRRSVAEDVEQARQAIQGLPEFQALSQGGQNAIWNEFLGQGKPLQRLPEAPLQTDEQLLAANREFSIAHLRSVESSIEAVVRQARLRVITLHAQEQVARGERERTVTWEPATAFAGRRFKTVEELEAAFREQLEQLKRQIAEGKEIQVL